MDFEDPSPDSGGAVAGRCPCDCLCCGTSGNWRRSMKRKLEAAAPPLVSAGPGAVTEVARVEAENEVAALREALGSHQQSVSELYSELEEERNAAATAASEAMSMILRLQREKAEAQMEARQFRRLAEEKMAHDQQEIAALEDLVFRRDQAVQAFSCELQALRHRIASLGYPISEPQTPTTPSQTNLLQDFSPLAFYPPLRCSTTTNPNAGDAYTDGDVEDLDKYAFGETPREQLDHLEQRICQLERTPSVVMEKGVVVGASHSPRWPRHLRRYSVDSFGSFSGSFKRGDEFPVAVDRTSDHGGADEMNDRVYTVDAVHRADELASTPREKIGVGMGGAEEVEIKKLYMRLQALEADRESMRQAIISMGTDKAQLVLLREVAQQLCKEAAPEKKKVVKKPSIIRGFSIISAIKWITSFIFWRKKATRCRYAFGLSSSNVGLLLLLDKSPRARQRRCLMKS